MIVSQLRRASRSSSPVDTQFVPLVIGGGGGGGIVGAIAGIVDK